MCVPSDICKDYDYRCLEATPVRSPQSRGFADFEAYSRTELPRLVEANLQAMINAEMAPLEENLRAMLVDIVRRCQSTVAQNYGRINSPIARTESPPFHPIQTLPPNFQSTTIQGSRPSLLPTTEHTSTQDSGLSSHEPSTTFRRSGPEIGNMRDFFEEPPPRNADMVDNFLDTGSAPQLPHLPLSDSGYWSGVFFCECPDRSDNCDGKLHLSQSFMVWYGSLNAAEILDAFTISLSWKHGQLSCSIRIWKF